MKKPFQNIFVISRVCILLVAVVGVEVLADSLDIICNSSLAMTYVSAKHNVGATEGYDASMDVSFLQGPSPAIDFYFQNANGNFKTDAKGPNSTTDFYIRIEGRGLSVNIDANLDFSIWANGEGNFDWKNLIVELCDDGIIGSTATLIGTYDGHDLADGLVSIPALTIQNGLSYQLIIKPRHYADINGDQYVRLEDLANISLNWQRNDCSPANTHCDYSDIDRDGGVNINDLVIEAENWLWKAEHL